MSSMWWEFSGQEVPQAQQQYFIPFIVVENGKRSQHVLCFTI